MVPVREQGAARNPLDGHHASVRTSAENRPSWLPYIVTSLTSRQLFSRLKELKNSRGIAADLHANEDK